MHKAPTLRVIPSSEKVINTKRSWILLIFELYLKLYVTSYCGTFFQHEYRRTKTKGTVTGSFPIFNFSLQISRNSVYDEESIAYLLCVHDNTDYKQLQYIYRHVRRCVYTLGGFGTRHVDSACVDSDLECHVDIFILQVRNFTGCHFCSTINVIKLLTKYSTKVVTWK
jgi:hypothetical protein